MDRPTPESKPLCSENVDKIGSLFPDCIVETADPDGKPVRRIDMEMLSRLLSDDAAEPPEVYEFTWVGKKAAACDASAPAAGKLIPCAEESVDWENTRNLYIEGDNLEVLKLLREEYAGGVKVIYIDPPYNTGKKYIYRNSFRQEKEQVGRLGGADPNSRAHSGWCSMIYPRLIAARELLSDDGVIFISIDDKEVANLKKLCEEVFGERNFIAQVIWERAFSPVNLKKHFSESHDHILCYAKNIDLASCNGLPRSAKANSRYSNPDNDPRGPWTSGDLSVGPRVESRVYEITVPSGRRILPPSGYCWRLDKETYEAYVKDGRIWFGTGDNVPRIKRFLSEVKKGITPMTIWKHSEVGHSQDATKRLKELFDGKAVFNYPKPVELIKRCIQLYSDEDSVVLDFFSGSAAAAHAVMKLNAEDGGSRSFIMVQLPEKTAKNSEAFRAGYENICEIGKERIRRAGAGIKADTGANIDCGFRVFKLSYADQ